MPVIKVNGLSKSDGEVFKAIPAGKYKVRVTGMKDGETKEKSKFPGTPKTFVMCKVIEGEHEGSPLSFDFLYPMADQDAEYRQRCVDRIKRICLAAGVETKTDEFDPADLMGQEMTLVVGVETVAGVTRNVVKDQLKG